jgi:hypothetical protein
MYVFIEEPARQHSSSCFLFFLRRKTRIVDRVVRFGREQDIVSGASDLGIVVSASCRAGRTCALTAPVLILEARI